MKQALQARQAQTLNLTPQLLQTIRLLQLTAPQLEMELRQALERNPLLESAIAEDEAEDDAPAADAAAQDCAAWDELPEPMFLSGGGHAGSGDEDATARIAAGESSDWRQRLLALLALQWRPHALAMAAFWLDHCDDRGYLEHDLQALGQRGATELGVGADDLEVARQRLLHGEWPGVAATDPAECLRAQLALQPEGPARALAARILADHLDLLAAHDTAALARALGAGEDGTHAAIALVLSLRPHPVEAVAADSGHIVPDVVAWHAGGTWRVALNDAALPRVRIAPHCEQALADAPGQYAALRGLLEEARWLVRGVAMRNETLLRTTQVLVERQRAFLERGEEAIAPLTLKEVADAIGMHESTVSRITTGKYLQTPRGTFELKRLFAVRLEGANVGATAVKAMVRRLIETEPANAPLADDVIAGLLARQGVRIARRTVAKYRDQLHIPSALARRARPRLATA
ncbi:MAG TPA: RNA polymerase factor sigma-54 [Xanthomonadaceae bacterium]|nr:RNA polymerase factor sigma-54 [Xanthomonadaceae bacterium]